MHHHLPEAISETAKVDNLRQTTSMHHPLYAVVVVVVGWCVKSRSYEN